MEKKHNQNSQSDLAQQSEGSMAPPPFQLMAEKGKEAEELSMDDVKVQYNDDKPVQLNAQAFAQGTDIHISPGQEKHLPHEAWHVTQQKQGRIQPSMIEEDED